jgi:RNA polymerase sigma-70 factor (ECF subfamily)
MLVRKAHEIDPAIIEGCKANDKKSQEQLYKILYSTLLKTCMVYSSCRAQAEDYLHSSFIKIFQSVNKYSGSGNFEGWARRVVRNTIFDDLKIEKRLPLADESCVFEIPEVEPEVPIDCYNGISMERIFNIIQSLSPGYRTVFNLRVFEGLEHQQIAETLKISEGASKSSYHRARLKIIEKLNEESCKV